MLIILCLPIAVQAKIVIASGAGNRSLVDKLTKAYTAQTGNEAERIYGNMARVTAQARNSGNVDFVLGDKGFLDKAQLDCCATHELGKGTLVLAFPRGGHFSGIEDFLNSKIKRIALPDTKRAIYGKAAMEFMRNKNILKKVKSKLLMVATVPQSASYIAAGEVDYAFINLTHARKISKTIGGYEVLDRSSYSPISIIVEQMQSSADKAECKAFLKFLNSGPARRIVADHGM